MNRLASTLSEIVIDAETLETLDLALAQRDEAIQALQALLVGIRDGNVIYRPVIDRRAYHTAEQQRSLDLADSVLANAPIAGSR